MKNIFLWLIMANFAIGCCGCKLSTNDSTENINLSEGTTIWVTQDGTVIIDENTVEVDKILEKLETLKVKPLT